MRLVPHEATIAVVDYKNIGNFVSKFCNKWENVVLYPSKMDFLYWLVERMKISNRLIGSRTR